jgi:hypothetical protein
MIQTQRTRPLGKRVAGPENRFSTSKYNASTLDQQAAWRDAWLARLESVGMAVAGLTLAPAHRQAGERAVSHLITVLTALGERGADHDPI